MSNLILGKQTSVRAISAIMGFSSVEKTDDLSPPRGSMAGVVYIGDIEYRGATIDIS